MTDVVTVMGLLCTGDDNATALFAPGGVPLSYRQLRAVVAETVAALNAHGIGRGDRVAILMDHPSVQQCLTFAMPHDKLGEEVAVVVVLRDGAEATAAELPEFAAKRLADFKVPKKVIFRPEIPKGATGKLQRIGLAQKLGLA